MTNNNFFYSLASENPALFNSLFADIINDFVNNPPTETLRELAYLDMEAFVEEIVNLCADSWSSIAVLSTETSELLSILSIPAILNKSYNEISALHANNIRLIPA